MSTTWSAGLPGLFSIGGGGSSAPHIPTFGGPLGILSIVMGILSAADQALAQKAAQEGNQELLKKIFEGYGESGRAALAVMSGTQSLGEWTQKYGSAADQQNSLYFGDAWSRQMPSLRNEAAGYSQDLKDLKDLRDGHKKFVQGDGSTADRYGIKTRADLDRYIGELETKTKGLTDQADAIQKQGPGGIVGQYDKLNTETQNKIARDKADQNAGYQKRESDVMAEIAKVGTQAGKDLETSYDSARSSALSRLAALGAGTSSAATGTAALIDRERGNARNRLAETLAGIKGGAIERLRGDTLGSDATYNAAGTNAGMNFGGQRIGAMERGGQNVIGARVAGAQGAIDSQNNWINTLKDVSIPYPSGSAAQTLAGTLGQVAGGRTQYPSTGGVSTNINATPAGVAGIWNMIRPAQAGTTDFAQPPAGDESDFFAQPLPWWQRPSVPKPYGARYKARSPYGNTFSFA